MSIHEELSSASFWAHGTVLPIPDAAHITGAPTDLEDQLRQLWSEARESAYIQRLPQGLALSDLAAHIPPHLCDNPWFLGVVVDTRRPGRVRHPEGLFMGRDDFVDEATFDARAQALATKPLELQQPAVALALPGEGERRRYTLKRELFYYLGRTLQGEMVDVRVNGEPSLLGLSSTRLPMPEATWRAFKASLPTATEIARVYTDRSGRKQRVASSAALVVPYIHQRAGPRRRLARVVVVAGNAATAPALY